jgi:hypothetical protein
LSTDNQHFSLSVIQVIILIIWDIVMIKFFLRAETEFTASEAGLGRIENAMGTPPDDRRDPLARATRQPASACGV